MEKILTPLFSFVKVLINILLIYMVVLITGQVLLRGFTGSSIKWGEETVLIAMVWVCFLTLALGVRYDIHIRIDLFMTRIPKTMRPKLEFALNLILFLISAMMVYYGGILTKFALASTLPATKLPTAVVYCIVPISGVFCLLHTLSLLIGASKSDVARRFINGDEFTEGEGK